MMLPLICLQGIFGSMIQHIFGIPHVQAFKCNKKVYIMHCSRTIPADIQRGHLRRSTLLSLVLALSSLVIAEPEPEPIAARDGDKCPGGSPQCSQTTYQKPSTAQFSLKQI